MSQMDRAEGKAFTRTDVPDGGTQEEGVCLSASRLLNWRNESEAEDSLVIVEVLCPQPPVSLD